MQRRDPFVPGEYYHVFNRGVDKRAIFKSTQDYKRFVMLLYVANSINPIRLDNLLNVAGLKYADVFRYARGEKLVSIGAWCLMTNHFHLLLKEQVTGGISSFMKKLGTAYSMYFNIRHDRSGALFEHPFKSRLVNEDSHLKHLFGYIHLNPLDIEFSGWKDSLTKPSSHAWKSFLAEYPYSSYADIHELGRSERSILDLKEFPEYFQERKDFQFFIDSYLSEDSILS